MIESEYKDVCNLYGSNSNIPTIKIDDKSQFIFVHNVLNFLLLNFAKIEEILV